MKTKEGLIDYLKNELGTDAYSIEYPNGSDKQTKELKEKFGEWEIVDEKGNTEGGGEYSHLVAYFKELDCYIKVTGYYSSYNGTDWENDWHEVFPKEKTITVYE